MPRKIARPKKTAAAPAKPKSGKPEANATAFQLLHYVNATAVPDMYQDYHTPRMLNLAMNWRRGTFDLARAHKAFAGAVYDAATAYRHSHPSAVFPYGAMKETCQMLAIQFTQDIEAKHWKRLGTAVWSVLTENGAHP